ncbi:CarD family transcriptional regulator, partial [Oleiphilus sp. HI0079]|uniref:CarD family transcriptional regulator n=4 Tax=unclassified Oleiphilus TaxID=2631174 RepID=UPI000AAD24D8
MTALSIPKDIFSNNSGKAMRVSCIKEGLPFFLSQVLEANNTHFSLVIAKDTQQANALVKSLRFFMGEKQGESVFLLPDWETLPYDSFSPHEDIVSERLKTLSALKNMNSGCLVVPVSTLVQRLPPTEFITANTLAIKIGERFDANSYRRALEQVGYRLVDTVFQHGEYAVRGSIFDVFPMGSSEPIRIELFDDEVDSLRSFDPETQRSKQKHEEITMLPGFEFPWDKASRLAFRNRWLDTFDERSFSSPILRDIKDGIKPHGIEYYSPLFFEHMASLFDYVPSNTQIIHDATLNDSLEHVWKEINERYEDHRYDIQRPILAPHTLFLGSEECFSSVNEYARMELDYDGQRSTHAHHASLSTLPDLAIDDRLDIPAFRIQEFVQSFDGQIVVVSESAGRRESIQDLFKDHNLSFQQATSWPLADDRGTLTLTVGALEHGFIATESKLAVVTETELFGQIVRQNRRRSSTSDNHDNFIKSLTELRIGAPVVHIDHGVGRYRGLETISVDGMTDEFLTLEYAGGSKLYVPIASLNLISRYSGTDEA